MIDGILEEVAQRGSVGSRCHTRPQVHLFLELFLQLQTPLATGPATTAEAADVTSLLAFARLVRVAIRARPAAWRGRRCPGRHASETIVRPVNGAGVGDRTQ